MWGACGTVPNDLQSVYRYKTKKIHGLYVEKLGYFYRAGQRGKCDLKSFNANKTDQIIELYIIKRFYISFGKRDMLRFITEKLVNTCAACCPQKQRRFQLMCNIYSTASPKRILLNVRKRSRFQKILKQWLSILFACIFWSWWLLIFWRGF